MSRADDLDSDQTTLYGLFAISSRGDRARTPVSSRSQTHLPGSYLPSLILSSPLFLRAWATCPKLAIFFAAFLFLAAPALAADIYPARVVNVHDGDTLTVVREDLAMVTIRLYGIDAPEDGQAHGKKAGRHLRKLAHKQLVTVEPIGKPDRYGRTVAIVRLDDQDLGREMIRAGYAWVYADYCKRKRPCGQYWGEVRQAIKEERGMWDGKAVPPWKWRKAGK